MSAARAALVALALALPAPAAAAAAAPTTRPGVLTVGLSMPVPNFQFGVVVGSRVVIAQGLEIDIVEAVARRLGIPRVEYVNEPGFLAVIRPGPKPYDLAIAEATITPQRARRVAFSTPYMRADQGVLLARQRRSAPVPRSLGELRRLRLCSGRGTTGADALRTRVRPQRPPLLLQTQRRLFAALRGGRCDAVVYDAPILAAVKAERPAVYGPLAGTIPTGERYGIVFQHGSALRPAVNRALRALAADGTLRALRDRWLKASSRRLPVLR